MLIAVDAMGGDYAPVEVVRGAVAVAAETVGRHEIVLVGQQDRIEQALSELAIPVTDNLTIRHAPDVIEMKEHPAHAIRKKRGSSLVVCGQMVKSGEAQGTMSAGNTGAAMAIAALDIGRIPGIERPAIATIMPSMKGESLLLDAGANVDCSPHNLLQFALLGSIYAERVMHISEPTIGLLSVGSEESKGNELTKATYKLLQRSPLRFYGNVEGKDVFEHITDVVVCDGFVGNVVLKSGEGLAELIMTLLRKHSESFPPECLKPVREMFGALMKSLDYAETGGAPLLGINGASVIAHGRSRHKAISNAIKNTIAAAESDMVAAVREALPHLVHREQAVVDGGAA